MSADYSQKFNVYNIENKLLVLCNMNLLDKRFYSNIDRDRLEFFENYDEITQHKFSYFRLKIIFNQKKNQSLINNG
jgi:hypothetical protein